MTSAGPLAHLGQALYLEYAEVGLADSGAAWELIHEVFLYILVAWDDMLVERSFMEAAWDVLRAAVAYEKRRQSRPSGPAGSPSFFWKMTFGHAVVSSRVRLSREPTELRQAIAQLPPRQFDVIVLKHFMERSRDEITWLLGIKPVTVDHHHRAPQQLRRDLGLPPLGGFHCRRRVAAHHPSPGPAAPSREGDQVIDKGTDTPLDLDAMLAAAGVAARARRRPRPPGWGSPAAFRRMKRDRTGVECGDRAAR